MPDQFSLTSRPRFRDLVIYEGLFELQQVAGRLFEWYGEVDPAAARRHAEYLRGLAGQGLSAEDIVRRSYDQLYQGLYDYCGPRATWGWEPIETAGGREAASRRLGFWPFSHELRAENPEEPSPDDLFELPPPPAPSHRWPLGPALQDTELFARLRAEDEAFIVELERFAGEQPEPESERSD